MKIMIVILTSILLAFGAATSSAADFTADMTISTPGEEATQAKVYMQGNKMRMEMAGEDDEKAITITRTDKKVVWTLMLEEKVYMEQSYQAEARMQEWTPQQESQSKLIGNEKVSGLDCKKYQVKGKQAFYWISEQINFPVKAQDPEGTMLLKNIRLEKVSGDLFEVPPGFEKVSMPGMGGMPPGLPGVPKGR